MVGEVITLPVKDYKELGEYLYKDSCLPEVNGYSIRKYIDFEKVGRDYAAGVNGNFIKDGFCYIMQIE